MSRKYEAIPTERDAHPLSCDLSALLGLIHHWFYKEGKRSRARPFADRLEVILLALGPDDESFGIQKGWALVYEVRGDLREAVRYREKEIVAWEMAFRTIDEHPDDKDLSNLRSLLKQDFVDSYVRAAMLYEKLGEPQKAYERLEKGERHARAHDLSFPHDDFFGRLRELIAQGKTGTTLTERGSPPPRRRRRSWPILNEAEIAEMRRIDAIPYEENPTTPLWWELDRLYTKIIHLRADGKERRARPFAKQLEKVLLALRPDDNSRRMQECWALVYETRGELRKAVEYREKDIALCKKWIRIMGPLDEKPLEEVFGNYESLETKHHFTSHLYEDLGEYEKAYAHMQKAKRLAHKHGFEFGDDSEDDLRWLRRQIRRKKKAND